MANKKMGEKVRALNKIEKEALAKEIFVDEIIKCNLNFISDSDDTNETEEYLEKLWTKIDWWQKGFSRHDEFYCRCNEAKDVVRCKYRKVVKNLIARHTQER